MSEHDSESSGATVIASLSVVSGLSESSVLKSHSLAGGDTLGGEAVLEVKNLYEGASLRVGRARSNDIVINNSNVSRFHAVFSASSSGVVLSDLSSLNGTFLNGSRISTPVDISSGDIVIIGDSRISVKLNHGDELGVVSDYGQTHTAKLASVVVSVLVVDVCRYTKISEALPPTDVAEMMHLWMQKISKIVGDHGGVVDKYIGDCVMALWKGEHGDADILAKKAMQAGLDMISETEELSASEHWGHANSTPWECRVALNTGEALMGTLGGEGRRDFTVLGDTVNVAFKLEDLAGKLGVRFVVSAASARLLKEEFNLIDLGSFPIEGRAGEVSIFTAEKFESLRESKQERPGINEEKFKKYLKLEVVSLILDQLRNELSADLKFHSLQHTVDVICEAVYFASKENKSKRDMELIAVAAAYHDAGFLFQRNSHEEVSAKLAQSAMIDSGEYSEEDISLVKQMILDTNVEQGFQPPSNRLSKYLQDADLSNFGRDDFFERLELSVLENSGHVRLDIYVKTLKLMRGHSWQTQAAKEEREEKKTQNIEALQKEITSLVKD